MREMQSMALHQRHKKEVEVKTETINCDRCHNIIPDGPPNSWFQNTTVPLWSTNGQANTTYDLCVNCYGDYTGLFLKNLDTPVR